MIWPFDKLFRRKASGEIQAPEFLRDGLTEYDAPYPYNAPRQEAFYALVSWIHTAIRILAQTSAGTPFQVMEWEGEEKIAIDNHPFELLLREPNPLQSRFEFLEATIAWRELTGNTYIWLNRSSETAPPSEMWIIPSDSIRPVPDEKLYLAGYEYDSGTGTPILLDTWEVCHLTRFNPANSFVGMSALDALATVTRGDIAMQKWNTKYFAEDNAKPAGALAFADRFNDTDWDTLKRDLVKEHGGTERRMMLLRNAGKGGVQWVQFGLSQKDMEFLDARTFNKEEIFATLAPGLASMLAVNATEANSVAGKATFMEMAVWPINQAVGEKFTSDILPSYGENLVGEFDDVRVSDREMKLKEQTASYNVLTVAEVREKYYDMLPLGDERDGALVQQVGEITPETIEVLTEQPTKSEDRLSEAITRLEQVSTVIQVPAPEDVNKPDARQDDNALRDDLLKWQRKLIKRVKADRPIDGVAFESDVIPSVLKSAIVGALSEEKTTSGVYRVFDDALTWGDDIPTWESYP